MHPHRQRDDVTGSVKEQEKCRTCLGTNGKRSIMELRQEESDINSFKEYKGIGNNRDLDQRKSSGDTNRS